MLLHRDALDFYGYATTGAFRMLLALCCAGGFGIYDPIGGIVSRCGSIILLKAVAAGADIEGISYISTRQAK